MRASQVVCLILVVAALFVALASLQASAGEPTCSSFSLLSRAFWSVGISQEFRRNSTRCGLFLTWNSCGPNEPSLFSLFEVVYIFEANDLPLYIYGETFLKFFASTFDWNNADAAGLHEEAGAFKKGKLPWWWDTDYIRSKRRRPIHN